MPGTAATAAARSAMSLPMAGPLVWLHGSVYVAIGGLVHQMTPIPSGPIWPFDIPNSPSVLQLVWASWNVRWTPLSVRPCSPAVSEPACGIVSRVGLGWGDAVGAGVGVASGPPGPVGRNR